jgi:hypothetical protein
LAACGSVHLVASFEHRLTPYAWDTVMLRQFNWLWNVRRESESRAPAHHHVPH